MILSYDSVRINFDRGLSKIAATGIAAAVLLYFVAGQALFPLWLLAILPVGLILGAYSVSSAKHSLYAFLTIVYALCLRTQTAQGTDGVDVVAGIGVLGLLAFWLIKTWVIHRESVATEWPQLFIHLFIAWAALLGVGGMVFWNNSANDWLREITIYSPLFMMPLLYQRSGIEEESSQSTLARFVLSSAVVLIIWSMAQYAFVVAKAFYAYEISRMLVDTASSTVLLLTCVACSMFDLKWMRTGTRLLLSMLAVGGLVLSGYRTMWISAALVTLLLLIIARPLERKSGLKFLLVLGGLLVGVATFLYFTVPLFELFILMQYGRLVSTSQVATDPSLMNRYIETATVISNIVKNPITGYGLGSHYLNWDWLLGYSYFTGYAHNGYTFIVFKSGLVGAFLLYSAFVGFLIKAVRLARDLTQTNGVRAVAAVGASFMVSLLIANYTLNVFGSRPQLTWLGLFWAFVLYQKIGQGTNRRRLQATS